MKVHVGEKAMLMPNFTIANEDHQVLTNITKNMGV